MYEEEYRRANRNLHPSEELVERAAAGAWRPGSKRRTFRLKVTSAVAAVLALVLLVTGIPGLGEAPAGGPVAGTAYALARPTLPQLPAMPEEPASGGDKAWEQFSEDYETYWEAWRAFRKESAGIDEQAGLMEALAAFSGQSAALALSGSENQIYSPLVPVVRLGYAGRDHGRGEPAGDFGRFGSGGCAAAARLGGQPVARPVYG